jgi:HNH endonuclease
LKRPVAERFWEKVDRRSDEDCWEWLASKSWGGYGFFSIEGFNRHAHRVAYELEVSAIPAGLTIDHLCRNRACVNPRHLEAVTGRVNTLRGNSFAAANARRTHCKHGHEFGPVTFAGHQRVRRCPECRRIGWKKQNERRKEQRRLRPPRLVVACPKGHPYIEGNLIRTRRGDKRCAACNRAWNKSHRANQSAA